MGSLKRLKKTLALSVYLPWIVSKIAESENQLVTKRSYVSRV